MRMFFAFLPLLFVGGVGISANLKADLDEWGLDDSVGGSVSVSYTYIDSDSAQNSINATLPFIANSQVHGYYGEYTQAYSEGDDFTSKDLSFGVTTDPYAFLSVGLSVDKFGENSSIAYKNTVISFDIDIASDLELIVRGLSGEIELNPGNFSEQTQALLVEFGLLSDERVGGGIEFRHHLEDWQWGMSYNDYQYDGYPSLTQEQRDQIEDSIRLDSLRFAYQLWLLGLDSQTTERYRREFIYSTLGAYRNAFRSQSILAEQDIAFNAQWYKYDTVLQFTFMMYESYIEEEFHNQLSVGANHPFFEQYDVGVRMIYADETSELFTEVSLGYSW